MKLLPTILARQLLKDKFQARMPDVPNPSAIDVIAVFQRMALVSDFETATNAARVFFAPEHRNISEHELAIMQIVFDTTPKDVLGHAVDALLEVMENRGVMAKDRIAAAAVINELFGEKQLIQDEKLTDRLMINLVGKAS